MDVTGHPEIYFACSIRGGRDDQEIYKAMVDHTKTKAIVLSELFADSTLTVDGTNKPSREIWKQDLDWVKRSDGVIAEVTNPSLGVGYEIGKAEEWHKPVLALFRDTGERKLSAMIDGSEHLEVVRYTELDQAFLAIDAFTKYLCKRPHRPTLNGFLKP